MIIHGGVSEMYTNERLRELGISEECFFSLPYEYQRALLNSGLDTIEKEKQKENARKKMALAQYDLEEKVKEKVLVLFKRKK